MPVTNSIHDAAQALLDAIEANWPLVSLHDTELGAAAKALRDALAARAQPTTDDVLWEGETRGPSWIAQAVEDEVGSSRVEVYVDAPPGTRVRVVRATDQPSEDQP